VHHDSSLKEFVMAQIRWLLIDEIKVSSKQHKKVAHSKVEKHRIAFESDRHVEPIDVIACPMGEVMAYRILGNGRHRYFGAIAAGMNMIPCKLHASRV
jgi:hypothetical protein